MSFCSECGHAAHAGECGDVYKLEGFFEICGCYGAGQDDNSLVRDFLLRMRLSPRRVAGWPSEEELRFRVAALHEEAREVEAAARERDLLGVADGLVDIVYFAHGFALRCGVDWRAAFGEVHRANMAKVRGPTSRGWLLDAQKPPGWRAPDHSKSLGAGPWPTHE